MRLNERLWTAALLMLSGFVEAQPVRLDHLPADKLDVTPPSARVQGAAGSMRVIDRSCPDPAAVDRRRRIIDIAIQEWAFFGFPVLDQTDVPEVRSPQASGPRRPRVWLDPDESARTAPAIAGYWAATPDGSWILDRQNEIWNGPQGIAARWRDPWSAAFISWVMCEAGLGEPSRFRRAIAHHTYIDQAIEARDAGDTEAAFAAFDVGERVIEPGDLLCVARRPNYQTVAERKVQLGTGIRSHCDIVVEVDVTNARILVIGGNVRGAVRLKLHAAEFSAGTANVSKVGRGRRSVFAHLKLAAASTSTDAFEASPTVRMLGGRREITALLQDRLRDESGQ